MTDEELKQRCLELGYDEEMIDDIIEETNIWSILRGKRGDYFGKLFGSKYDDEEALREVIDNWDALLLINAVHEDKEKHPEDYKVEGTGTDDDDAVSFDELEICINCGRGPYPGEERWLTTKR